MNVINLIKPSTKSVGDKAEKYALNYLKRQGLKKVACNYRSRYGEVDIIMRDQTSLIFIEVRYRKNQRFGRAEETVDARKQKKIQTTALSFIQAFPQYTPLPLRFDVIAMTDNASGDGYALEWIEHAFI